MNRAARLLVATLLVSAAEDRVRTPTAERPTIADSIEMRVPWDSNYLRGKQVVGIISPRGGPRRYSRAAKGFVGAEPRTQGIEWMVQPEFKPFKRLRGKRPFKVRLLHMDPRDMLVKLEKERKVTITPFEVPSGEYKGRLAIAVRLKKEKPWYRKWV